MQEKEPIRAGALVASIASASNITKSEMNWAYIHMSNFEFFNHSFILVCRN